MSKILNDDGSVSHELGWVPTADEHRRAYVMELYANSELDPMKELEGLDMRVEWLRTGKINPLIKATTLRPVK